MSLENLKLITNYKEIKLDSTSVDLFYVEYVDESDDKYIRELKAKRREAAIDVVLGEKEESELDEIKIHQQTNTFGTMIAPSVYSVSSRVKNYTECDQIYDDLLQFIDKETNSQKNIPSNIDLVFKKDEDYEAFCRKIMFRLTMCSNIIAMEGRIGIATFALVSASNWEFFKRIEDINMNPFCRRFGILGLKIIYTDKIQKDKVIIGRSNNTDQSGISFFIDLENKKYSRFESNLWKKQYCWFKIIK
jgi:hypothetical protein